MKILVSGASGFLGKALVSSLKKNHQVLTLGRSKKTADIYWNLENNFIESDKLNNLDAVIHLAGENVFGRWTKAKKKKIYNSRIKGTEFLVAALLKQDIKIKTFLSASATGYYGSDPYGRGFLAKVCKDWEEASHLLTDAGVRVCYLRFGIILDESGGMLKKLKLPFKLGLGAWLGNGKQYMSWISLKDTLRGIEFLLEKNNLSGAFNFVSPNPCTNKEFSLSLAKAYRRPCLFGIPEVILQLAFSREFCREVLGSIKVFPEEILEAGFKFGEKKIAFLTEKIFL